MIIKIYYKTDTILTIDNVNMVHSGSYILDESKVTQATENTLIDKIFEDIPGDGVNVFKSLLDWKTFKRDGRFKGQFNYVVFESEDLLHTIVFSQKCYICNNDGKTITIVG